MKKLLFGGCILLIVSSCDNASKNGSTSTTDTSVAEVKPKLLARAFAGQGWTLNGFPEGDAKTMISNYKAHYLKDVNREKATSVFYTVAELAPIFALLEQESKSTTTPLTGIRFYLGAAKEPAPGTTELKSTILMIPTIDDPSVQPPASIHVDYYSHAGSALPLSGTEYDDGNGGVAHAGGHGSGGFYKPSSANGSCNKPCTHFLPYGLANIWIRARDGGSNNKMPYNTISEWFEYKCFMQPLLSLIVNGDKQGRKFSGLRVYLGHGYKYVNSQHPQGITKDIFIMFPTIKTNNGDEEYLDCLEDLVTTDGSKFCDEAALMHILRNPKMRYPFTKDGAGYDEGELCPDNCNPDPSDSTKTDSTKKAIRTFKKPAKSN